MKPDWMILTDYAAKFRISVSTLRRRIKAGEIQYRFENGKYYVLDIAPEVTAASDRPLAFPISEDDIEFENESERPREHVEPILSSASQVLTDIKKAYAMILQEREEQIIQLKREISDLKTLVAVLESENERLSSLYGGNQRKSEIEFRDL